MRAPAAVPQPAVAVAPQPAPRLAAAGGEPPRAESAPPLDARRFRAAMAQWPTGVAVVSGYDGQGHPLGFVVGSLCSVSLEPMLVAFCVQKASSSWVHFRAQGRFAISFLAAGQADLCWRFAAGDPAKRYEGLAYELTPARQPRLPGSCAWLDVRLANEVEAGDHWLALCEVTALDTLPNTLPLAFARGRLNRLEPCNTAAPDHFERWETTLNALQFGT